MPADRAGRAVKVRVLRALLYAYGGAVLAGLLVAVVGFGFDLTHQAVVSAASLTGTVFGIAGFTLPWWQPRIAARSRSRGK
ncbi:MAG TPA: hypothetical protein VIK47_01670 [Kiloniellales bacterium]